MNSTFESQSITDMKAAAQRLIDHVERGGADGEPGEAAMRKMAATLQRAVVRYERDVAGVCGFDMGEGDACLLDAGHQGQHS